MRRTYETGTTASVVRTTNRLISAFMRFKLEGGIKAIPEIIKGSGDPPVCGLSVSRKGLEVDITT